MATTPSGFLSVPFLGLRTILAATPTWQSVCGVATADDAAEKIFEFELPVPEDDVPPELPAIVLGDADGLEQKITWDGENYGQTAVEIYLPLTITEADPILRARELQFLFRNQVSTLLREALALRATRIGATAESYMNLISWKKLISPQELVDADPRFRTADVMWCAFIAEWR